MMQLSDPEALCEFHTICTRDTPLHNSILQYHIIYILILTFCFIAVLHIILTVSERSL